MNLFKIQNNNKLNNKKNLKILRNKNKFEKNINNYIRSMII